MIHVFKLSNLKSLYCEYLTSFGATSEYVKYVHSTRLKQRLMEIIQKRKRCVDVKDTAGLAIYEACMQNNEESGTVLSKAANIIRRDVFAHEISNSNLLLPNTQEMSDPIFSSVTNRYDYCTSADREYCIC